MRTTKLKATPNDGSEAPPQRTDDTNPPRLIILPKRITREASIITLAHPRTCIPTRYYFCPKTGIYEFTIVTIPKSASKSWLLSPSSRDDILDGFSATENRSRPDPNDDARTRKDDPTSTGGYVLKTPELLTATPIDPVFLLLPILSPRPVLPKRGPSKSLYLSSDDLFENASSLARHFGRIVGNPLLKRLLVQRLVAVCDTVEVGEEKMYRLSLSKLVHTLVLKAKRVASKRLPASMEDKFVKRALEVPMMAVKRQETTMSEASTQENMDSDSTTPIPITNSQSSTNIAITVPDPPHEPQCGPSEELLHLLRLRTALSYLLSSYVPAHLASQLEDVLAASNVDIDFTSLDEHISHVSSLRAKALESRSIMDMARKRLMTEDDEGAEARSEKRRKKDEEEQRKRAGESRAVKNLKKVDTTGMKKMSDFFNKVALKK